MQASVYYPILLVAAFLFAAIAYSAWPWLKQKIQRDKAATLVATTFFLALALYLHLGSPFQLADIEQQRSETHAAIARVAELESMRQTAEMDALKWAELGAAYMGMEQYTQAAEALRHAVSASEGDPNLIMAYGKAQMLAADGQVTQGAKEAFEMASMLMPQNPEPFFLLAVERMQAGDKPAAHALFAELLPKLPEGAPLRATIEAQLESKE